MATLKEKIEALQTKAGNREDVVTAIKLYKSLVHYKDGQFGYLNTSSGHSYEETVQEFVDEIVNTTFGLVWNVIELPFSIVNLDNEDLLYEDETIVLARWLHNEITNFKTALRQVLRMYFEFGTAFLYLYVNKDIKAFCHRVYSLQFVHTGYDEFGALTEAYINSCDFRTYMVRQKDLKWKIYNVSESMEVRLETEVDFCPIFELSEVRVEDSQYPHGKGLQALPDIIHFDAVIKSITTASASILCPQKWVDSSLNVENKDKDICRNNDTIVTDAVAGIGPAVGYIQNPAQVAPAWELIQLLSSRLRQKFGLLNRLLVVKENVQMTATEVNVMAQQDRNRIRDFSDMIYSFLNKVHIAQFKILDDYKAFGKTKPIGIKKLEWLNIEFRHNSVFEKIHEQEQLTEMNAGLDLVGKTIQTALLAQQAGADIDLTDALTRIANLTGLVTTQPAQPQVGQQAIQQIQQSFQQSQDAQEV